MRQAHFMRVHRLRYFDLRNLRRLIVGELDDAGLRLQFLDIVPLVGMVSYVADGADGGVAGKGDAGALCEDVIDCDAVFVWLVEEDGFGEVELGGYGLLLLFCKRCGSCYPNDR